jgi:hypothetical protein
MAMQQALRPYAGAGVALAGAGLIAITPVAGISLDVQSRAVQLMSTGSVLDPADLIAPALTAAQAYPITTPAELVANTASNLEFLQNEFAANPFPILEQIIANQAGYSNDLATAAENATSDFTSAVQGLPDVFQQAAADFSQGDVYDAVTGPYSYLLTNALDVNHDLVNGFSEVVQGITNNFGNLVNDTGAIFADAAGLGTNSVPVWLTDLIVAPLYGPNAAVSAIAGVSQDILTAATSGDSATALSDMANAPSTILDAFLNGYQVNAFATPDAATDVLARLGLPAQFGLLTHAGLVRAQDDVAELAQRLVGGGTLQNFLAARVEIANDISPREEFANFAGLADAHTASLESLLGGANLELPDFSTLLSDLSTALSPDALLGDLTSLFDPSAATDIGAQLSTDLSTVLLSLF